MEKLIKLIEECDILIFDFDGTLINSEPYHKLAHDKIFSMLLKKDIHMTDEEFSQYIGKTDKQIYSIVKEKFNLDFDVDKAINKKVEIALNMVKEKDKKIFDYFFDVLKIKKNKDFYIVSNQHPYLLNELLKAKDIYKYFTKIYCLSEMQVRKDDFYNNIENYINIKDKKVAVFEDSNNVIKQVKSMGFTGIGVETEINRGKLTDVDYLIKY